MNGSKNVIIACVYRKPGSQIDEFTTKLEELFGNIKNNKVLYLCGDYNIDLIKENSHKQTKQFIDTMFSVGLFPLITKPSRITNHSATLIDNIFTNETKHENVSGLIINDITDHLPIFTVFRYKVKRLEDDSFIQQRKIDDEAIKLLHFRFEKLHWQDVYAQKNVNDCYNIFF